MSDRPYAAYWFDELPPHKIHLARRDGCLLVTLASSGGQKGEARGPGRDLAFERLLRRLSDAFPSGRARAYRAGSQQGQRAVRVDGLLAANHTTLLAAKTSGGDYRFDLWVEGIPDAEIETVASTLGLVKHRDQHAQPRTLPPLAELLPPPETRAIPLPKPFVLLAGLSGTGKTSFVREQARRARADEGNFALIPVRPDWHEPSELFGHLSRIHGERFLATPFLKFVAHAWREAVASADADHLRLRPLDDIPTFWACLDEMNLAPVEQYLADYLSVLESRRWDGERYDSDALLPLHRLGLSPPVLDDLRAQLGLAGDADAGLWRYFVARGVPLPPNLVVAGTVNMDETTHGFSRKVIDRAFTLDFGAFFPTDLRGYFAPSSRAVTFTFPRRARVSIEDLAGCCDPEGLRSIAFLERINQELQGTPFELSYRALNELLLAVASFAPTSDDTLRAVWDDFLLTKILPRFEGDAMQMRVDENASLLTRVRDAVREQLRPGGDGGDHRPDLFRTRSDGEPLAVTFRAPAALDRMQERLTRHNFTSFWP